MYRIGEPTEMTEIAPDTIRCYEKQQTIEHEVRTGSGFRLYTGNDLQRLKFIRHARQLGFSLESIRRLLSIHIDPEYHACQELKGIVQERLRKVETRVAELQSMQRSLQRLNDTCCETVHSSVYCSILEILKQGTNDVKSGCWFFVPAGLHSRRQITNWSFYEPISAYRRVDKGQCDRSITT